MEIRNITTFVKIVEYNNFTKAAESLGYSQAAVTAQIKSLEAELGVPLFDRIGRGIALTEEGKTFLPYALDVLNAEEAARNSVRPAEELVGTLQIWSPSSFAAGPLPDLLREFHELHPQVDVIVKISDYLEDNLLKLTRGEIDFLVILDEPNAFPDFRLFAEKPAPIIFVTHPANPLHKKKTYKIHDLLESDFIVCDRDPAQRVRDFLYSRVYGRRSFGTGQARPAQVQRIRYRVSVRFAMQSQPLDQPYHAGIYPDRRRKVVTCFWLISP